GWKIGILLAGGLLGLGALAVWGLPLLQDATAPPGPGLPPLAAVVYEDAAGGISRWDAGTAAVQSLVGATEPRLQLLGVSADGGQVAYLVAPAPPPATPLPTPGAPELSPVAGDTAAPAYTLRLWQDGSPPLDVPVPEGVAPGLAVQFLDSGDLAVLLHATARRPGPLYLYNPDAGRLRQVSPTLDSFALGRGLLAYAAPETTPAPAGAGGRHVVALFDVAGAGPATPVLSVTVPAESRRPIQLYYEPAHNAFLSVAARANGTGGLVNQLGLGLFLADAPALAHEVTLDTNTGTEGLAISSSGQYLLYQGVGPQAIPHIPPAQLHVGVPWRVAALDWSGDAPRLTQDRELTLPDDLFANSVVFLPGHDRLVVVAQHIAGQVQGGITYPVPLSPTLLLDDLATGQIETVLDNRAATVLAALDARRLLLALAAGPAEGQPDQPPRLALAERQNGGWQVQPLGDAFPSGTQLRFAGLLPDTRAVLLAAVPGSAGAATFYRVPLDGSPRTPLATLPAAAAYFPIPAP
ncbi:MAG TPA: hypothetical protein VKY74_20145, partial [Chloroflexia bacterium]|nr:hypothetical protein [Chloroflexia bacterium]